MQNGLLLQNLGIQQWYPRKTRHSWYQKKDIIIEISPAILQVKCLVLLPLYDKKELSASGKKISNGMLEVLTLAKNELSLAKIYSTNIYINKQDLQQIFAEINIWKPQFILLLNKPVSIKDYLQNDFDIKYDANLIQTYHPEHLAMHQQDKALAYQELLILKDKLHTKSHTYDHLT